MTNPFMARPKNDDGPIDPGTGAAPEGGGPLLGAVGPVDDSDGAQVDVQAPVDPEAEVDPQAGVPVGVAGTDAADDNDGDDDVLPSRSKLDAMRKAELKALADSRGVRYDGDATKDELVDALERDAGR